MDKRVMGCAGYRLVSQSQHLTPMESPTLVLKHLDTDLCVKEIPPRRYPPSSPSQEQACWKISPCEYPRTRVLETYTPLDTMGSPSPSERAFRLMPARCRNPAISRGALYPSLRRVVCNRYQIVSHRP